MELSVDNVDGPACCVALGEKWNTDEETPDELRSLCGVPDASKEGVRAADAPNVEKPAATAENCAGASTKPGCGVLSVVDPN